MKVLFILPYFSPHVGGVENYVLSIARGLQKLDWDVIVVTSSSEVSSEKKETLHGITVYRLPVQFKLSNTPINLSWSDSIKKIVTSVHPNLINAHTPVPYMADVASRVAAKFGIPFVLTYHNDVLKENFALAMIARMYYLLLGNTTLKLSNQIIVTSSQYVLNSKYLRLHSMKCEVVPPGIETYGNGRWVDVYKDPYILFVGQLDRTHRHKGLLCLLEAMEMLSSDSHPIHLKVAGTGNDIPYYTQWIKEHGMQRFVTLCGFVEDKKLSEIYAGAICLCLPSTSAAEGFGMVVLEAATQKTPSIGSRIGGIPQSIVDGKTGLLFPPKDSRALAQAVRKLLNSPTFRNKLGENAFERVRRDFNWEQQIKKTDQLFRKLLI